MILKKLELKDIDGRICLEIMLEIVRRYNGYEGQHDELQMYKSISLAQTVELAEQQKLIEEIRNRKRSGETSLVEQVASLQRKGKEYQKLIEQLVRTIKNAMAVFSENTAPLVFRDFKRAITYYEDSALAAAKEKK